MKDLVRVLLVSLYGALVISNVVCSENIQIPPYSYSPWNLFDKQCVYSSEVVQDYQRAIYEFGTNVFKRIANESGNHFNFSPLSLWVSLAAVAEGADGTARKELFNLLNLPEDLCLRQQYYMIAVGREYSGDDVTLSRTRLFVFDDNLILNQMWEKFVCNNKLIGIIRAPLKRDPLRSVDLLKRLSSVQISNLDMSGNSIMLDTFDYNGLWTTAFSGGIIEQVPFHNDLGEIIGSVNMIKMRKRVKLMHLPESNLKVLELPVGYNSRYIIMAGLSLGNSGITKAAELFKSEYMFKIIQNLRVSHTPLDIRIPQFTVSSEIDMRRILEGLGVKSFWTDPYATRNISIPSALPSDFVQRITVTLNQPGITPYTEDCDPKIDENEDIGFDIEFGRDFIADKPFMLGLFDRETYSPIFAAIFSKPLV